MFYIFAWIGWILKAIFPWLMAGSQNVHWALSLFVFIMMSLVGVFAPSFMESEKGEHRRPYDDSKRTHECLAKHQLAYVTLYLNVLLTVIVMKIDPVAAIGIAILLIVSFLIYFGALHMVKHQDARIQKIVGRRSEVADSTDLTWRERFAFWSVTIWLSVASLGIALLVIFSPLVVL